MTDRDGKSELEMIREIDDSDVDLPEGVADFIEECLTRVEKGKPLTAKARRKVQVLLNYVRRKSSSYDD